MARKNGKAKIPRAAVSVDGFYRVNIVDPDGRIAGDSGWHHNLIPSAGLTNYITKLVAGTTGSSVASYMALGSSQSSLASNASSLVGEYTGASYQSIGTRTWVTRAANTDGDTTRFLAIWTSNGVFTTTKTIACIGLYNSTSGNSIFCGGSFASSTLGASQAINATYEIVFSASSTD